MVVDLLAGFARENMSARKTLLCIEYLHQMLQGAAEAEPEWEEEFANLKRHIFAQVKILITAIIKPQPARDPKTPLLSRNDDKSETRSETDSCDQLSTKSDQLTGEGNATNLALYFLKPPVFSQLDQSLCERVNRHMILDLFVQSARSISMDPVSSDQVAYDVHKTL